LARLASNAAVQYIHMLATATADILHEKHRRSYFCGMMYYIQLTLN